MVVRMIASVKAELLSRGIRFETAHPFSSIARKGGAGPAEGITIVLEGSPASIPLSSPFVASSPYSLVSEDAQWVLLRDGERVCEVDIPREPQFYSRETGEGTPYRSIALLHGRDCLASTILQQCDYWGSPSGCAFCGIGLSLRDGKTLRIKKPDELAEVARTATEEGVTHVTLTAGSTRDRAKEWSLYLQCARAIGQSTGLPVHVQFLPRLSRERMDALRDAGVTSPGIHLESFDEGALRRHAPCKAAIDINEYWRAWRDAVEVFGRGEVSSFILLGLGEDRCGLIDNLRRLAEIGVYPFLVPFRPIPGTPLAGLRPPDPEACKDLYQETALILKECGISWTRVSAGCVRCRGCSALPDFEDVLETDQEVALNCRVVCDEAHLKECLRIRHEVFVEEQGIFSENDADGLDQASFHIVALARGEPVGTVRITPLNGDTWLGSRLAVRRPFRQRCGAQLVRKAEEEVRARGGRHFVAYIQLPKVPFFDRCGWRCVREVPDYHGRPHMLMEASLWPKAAERKGAGVKGL